MNPFGFKEFTKTHLAYTYEMRDRLESASCDDVGCVRPCGDSYKCIKCPFSTNNNKNGRACHYSIGEFRKSRPSQMLVVIKAVLDFYDGRYWRVE